MSNSSRRALGFCSLDISMTDKIEIGVSDEERLKRKEILSKSTAKDLEKNWADQDRQEIEAAEKSLAPPIRTEARCLVCTNPHRVWIERQLVMGRPYEAIANACLPNEAGKKPSRKSMSHHFKNHMPIQDMIARAELEEQADLLRQNYETSAKGAITSRGVIDVVVRKIYEDAQDNIVSGEIKDLVQLIKLKNEMSTNESQIKTEELESFFRLFTKAIQNIFNTEQQGELKNEIRRLREEEALEAPVEDAMKIPAAEIEASAIDDIPNTE